MVSAWVEGHGELRVRIRESREAESVTGELFDSRAAAVAFVDQWLASLLDQSGG